MRDVDLETLLALDIPAPRPARRSLAKARALTAFETTYHRGHQRGIGAALARTLVRSSQPTWHLIAGIFDSPWTITVLRMATSLLALILFAVAVVAVFIATSA